MKQKPYNIYKAGSANYYKDVLEIISAVAYCYDGYDPNNAEQMKDLVDELGKIARDGLAKKKMYIKVEPNEK